MLPAHCPGCPLARTPARPAPSAPVRSRFQQHRFASSSHLHQIESSNEPQCSYSAESSEQHNAHRRRVASLLASEAMRAAGKFKRGLQQLCSIDKPAQMQRGMLKGEILSAFALVAIPGCGLADLLANRVFMAGFCAWFIAQFAKIFTRRVKTGKWDVRAVVDSGGMPSSHSALCSGVTTAIAVQHGLGSSLFAVALCFSVIVMYDAAGVRRHAGKHAEVLNYVIVELLEEGHPVSEIKLKEVLGHTPLQVCAGAVLGVVMGLLYPYPAAPVLAV